MIIIIVIVIIIAITVVKIIGILPVEIMRPNLRTTR